MVWVAWWSIWLSLFIVHISFFLFFFNDTATTEIYTLSLHDALPICVLQKRLKLTLLFRIVLDLSSVLMQKSTKRAFIQASTASTYYVSILYSYILTLSQIRIKTERWSLSSTHFSQMYLPERRLLKFKRI